MRVFVCKSRINTSIRDSLTLRRYLPAQLSFNSFAIGLFLKYIADNPTPVLRASSKTEARWNTRRNTTVDRHNQVDEIDIYFHASRSRS